MLYGRWVFFDGLRRSEAQRYCDAFVAQRSVQLDNLVRWLRADRVKVGQFDASLTSWPRLWDWFITFVDRGLPSVPVDARPFSWVSEVHLPARLSPETARDRHRLRYAAEPLYYYFGELVAAIRPEARWTVHTGPRNDMLYHQTVLRTGAGIAWPPYTVQSLACRLVDPEFQDHLNPRSPAVFLDFTRLTLRSLGIESAPSIPAARHPLVSRLPEGRTEVTAPWVELPPQRGGPLHPVPLPGDPASRTPAGTRSDELYLFRGRPRDIDGRASRLQALDHVLVEDAFRDLGFASLDAEGDWAIQTNLKDDEVYDANVTANIEIVLAKGSIRFLCLQLHNTPPDRAEQILDRYQRLADDLGAQVQGSSEIDW